MNSLLTCSLEVITRALLISLGGMNCYKNKKDSLRAVLFGFEDLGLIKSIRPN